MQFEKQISKCLIFSQCANNSVYTVYATIKKNNAFNDEWKQDALSQITDF